MNIFWTMWWYDDKKNAHPGYLTAHPSIASKNRAWHLYNNLGLFENDMVCVLDQGWN